MIDRESIRLVQRKLAAAGLYKDAVDGQAGPNTRSAVQKALSTRAGTLPGGWEGWPDRRKLVACLQLFAREASIETGPIDGFWGPQTSFAADSLKFHERTGKLPPNWRDGEVRPPRNPNRWPKEDQKALDAFFGPHGLPEGRSPELARVEVPWKLKLAWNPRDTTTRIACNRAVAESLSRVLARVHDSYGEKEIRDLRLDLYGGCYNPRRKRGGSSLSTHSWAIAVDWDPDGNQLRWGRDRARMARPEYDEWWDAWEDEGWHSLGRARNFDWMHIQATV
jgi:hypothetical protein